MRKVREEYERTRKVRWVLAAKDTLHLQRVTTGNRDTKAQNKKAKQKSIVHKYRVNKSSWHERDNMQDEHGRLELEQGWQ